MLVNLDESAYTCGLAEQKRCIHTHVGSQKERHGHVLKLSFGPRHLVRGIWSMVFGLKY